MTDRKAYIDKAQARIDQVDAEIRKLEAKSDEVDADARIAYQNALQDARQKRDEMRMKMKDLQSRGDAAWNDIANGIDKAWTDLNQSVKAAANQFG